MHHVTWPRLVPLSLRLHASKAVLEQDYHYETLTTDSDSLLSLRSIEKYITARSPDESYRWIKPDTSIGSGKKPPLDECFDKVLADFNTDYQSSCPSSTIASDLRKSLFNTFEAGCCARCPSSNDTDNTQQCKWTKETEQTDVNTLYASGTCLDPVKDIFSICDAIARKAYHNYAGVSPSARMLELCTGHMHSRNAYTDIAIEGLTSENPNKVSSNRFVRVSFHVNSFWFHDYLSLPYLLIHECIAHGYCGVDDVASPDSETSKSFHDGWMDVIALSILDGGIRDERGGQAQVLLRQHADYLMDQSKRVHSKRYDHNQKAAHADVCDWIRGVQALNTFTWLVALALIDLGKCLSPDEPIVRQEILEISLSINASPLCHKDRGDLVILLTTNFCRSSEAARAKALSRNPSVLEHLKAYFVGHRSIEKLVSSMLAIRM